MAKKKEEDPLYRKVCKSSSSCTEERKTTTLSDMEVTLCTQCFNIFSWEKISIDKKSVAVKSKSGNKEAVEAKTRETIAEIKGESDLTKVVKASPNIIVASISPEGPVVEETNPVTAEADQMKAAFAGVDAIMNEVSTIVEDAKEPVTAVDPLPDGFDPFADLNVMNQKITGYYLIDGVSIKAPNIVRLISFNESKKNKWLLDVETDPVKVKAISDKPQLVIGKYVKVEYYELDDKGCPKEPVYVAMVKQPE